MIPIQTVFVGLVILFGIIGALRGWAKELLVTFSVILARFVEMVFLQYVPVVNTSLQTLRAGDPQTWFYVQMIIFIIIVAFGYATTVISQRLGSRARKEKLQDTLLGFFLGGINGFLVIGMMWGFLHIKGYNTISGTNHATHYNIRQQSLCYRHFKKEDRIRGPRNHIFY